METLYTVVWALQTILAFSKESRRRPWAQKIISSTTMSRDFVLSCSPIAFDNNNHVLCPSGQIDLATGAEELIIYQVRSCHGWNFSFSGDGRKFAYSTDDVGNKALGVVVRSCIQGADEVGLRPFRVSSDSSLLGLGQTGRYIAWIVLERKCYSCHVRDLQESQTTQLDIPELDFATEYRQRLLFSKDESMLCGLFFGTDKTGRTITTILVWRIESSEFILQSTEDG
jgi:hypothetical protein